MSRTPEPRPEHPAASRVVVVGAGPTGLLLAGDLAEAGVEVTVLERRPSGRSPLTRAFVVHARTLEQLDARGLADDLIAAGHRLDHLNLFGRMALDATRLRTRFPFVLVVPQYEVERLLERRAAAAGVTFVRSTRVVGLEQDADGVTVLARPQGPEQGQADAGAERTAPAGPAPEHGAGTKDASGDSRGGGADLVPYRCAYAVGADGVRSTVRSALGLPFPGRSAIRSMVLADVRLTEEPATPFTVNSTRGTMAILASFGDGWYRTMTWNRHRQEPDTAPAGLDEVRDSVRQAFDTDHGLHDPRWISRFHSDERQVPRYREGRVLLAGDAAHSHSPAGGLGMNTGLQDAANLGWKLAAVLHGRSGAELLDTYHDERHPVGRTVLRASGALLRSALANRAPERAARAAFLRLARNCRSLTDRAMRTVSGLAFAYDAGPGAHPLAGTRAPDLRLAGGRRLYQELRGGRFVLVTPAGERPPHEGDAPLTHAEWAGGRRTALLVRPDGHVAWATDTSAPRERDRELRAALAHWTGATP